MHTVLFSDFFSILKATRPVYCHIMIFKIQSRTKKETSIISLILKILVRGCGVERGSDATGLNIPSIFPHCIHKNGWKSSLKIIVLF